jgi:hypothetical protein
MTLRKHTYTISQNVGGKDHWARILLTDKDEILPYGFVTGRWEHTNESYNEKEIQFTSVNPEYFYFQWLHSEPGGILYIGTLRTTSHTDKDFQAIITLLGVKRLADGEVKVASASGEGSGKLTNNSAHFQAGPITWIVSPFFPR